LTGADPPLSAPPPRMMARAHRYANLTAVSVPAIAVIAGGVWTWGAGLHFADLVALVIMYAVSGFGITVGFHRLLTHRAFIAPRWHAFPRSAGHGLRRFELDPSHDFIVALEHIGLALHVVRIPAERQLTARAMNPRARQGGEDVADPLTRAAAIGREPPHRRP
jgi:fatty-acid desaturase